MPTMLSRKMGDNRFIITAELAPPRGSDMSAFLRMAAFCSTPRGRHQCHRQPGRQYAHDPADRVSAAGA